MDTVTVAELKAKLSHYLREVREGRTFTVLSRDIPVAMLGPCVPEEVDDLESIAADPAAPPLLEPVMGSPRHALPDAVELLRADRDGRDGRLAEIVRDALEARRGREEEGGR